jgi:hypothetical protein
MKIEDLVAMSQVKNAAKKYSVLEAMAMKLVKMAHDGDVGARHFIWHDVLGTPAKYIGTGSLELDSAKIRKEIAEDDSHIDMVWLAKWTSHQTLNFVGHPAEFDQVLKISKSLSDIISKRDALEYAKNNAYSQKEMQEVLDSVSSSMQTMFSQEPKKFTQFKDILIDDLQDTSVFTKLKEVGDN